MTFHPEEKAKFTSDLEVSTTYNTNNTNIHDNNLTHNHLAQKSSVNSKEEAFMKDIASHLNSLEYKIWLSDMEIQEKENKLFLYTSSTFKQEQITKRYWHLLKELANRYFPSLNLEWKDKTKNFSSDRIVSPNEEFSFTTKESIPENLSQEENPTNLSNENDAFIPQPRRILPENTWENLLEIPENKLARHFITQSLERPGSINPIYLYGFVGVGKTHLLHAFAQAYRERVPFARIEYLTPDDFVSDFTRALKTKTDRSFRIYYRSLDALLIDDIQFFMGKEKSSQEFFHVFNAIHASGKQMVFTSDRDPRELEHLDDRLKSRISSSAIIEIKAPEKDSRLSLIDFYAKKSKLHLSDEIKDFLSIHLPPDIRQIVGAIRYLSALTSFNEDSAKPLTSDFCQEYLKQLRKRPILKKCSPEKILYAVCDQFGFTIKDLRTKKKSKQISHCRQTAMYLLRQYTDLSLTEIGFTLGGRSVSAITYGIEKTEKKLLSSHGKRLKQELDKIMNKALTTSVF